jgi:hypothetical protein
MNYTPMKEKNRGRKDSLCKKEQSRAIELMEEFADLREPEPVALMDYQQRLKYFGYEDSLMALEILLGGKNKNWNPKKDLVN